MKQLIVFLLCLFLGFSYCMATLIGRTGSPGEGNTSGGATTTTTSTKEICSGTCLFECGWEEGTTTGCGADDFDSAVGDGLTAESVATIEGSYVLQSTGGGADYVLDDDGGGDYDEGDMYARICFRWTAETLSDGQNIPFLTFRSSVSLAQVRLIDNSGTINIQGRGWDGDSSENFGSYTVTQNTWYQVELKYDNDTEIGFKVYNQAGTQVYPGSGWETLATVTSSLVDSIRVGNADSYEATMQYDVLGVKTSEVGAY